MIIILIAIFLIIDVIVISNNYPGTKSDVWFYSVLTPIAQIIVISLILASLDDSPFQFKYKWGGAIAICFPSLIISFLTLFFCLKKKLVLDEDYKLPKSLISTIVILAILGAASMFGNYLHDKRLKEYQEEHSEEKRTTLSDKEWDALIAESYVPEDMNQETKIFNEKLPIELINGLTLQKCCLNGFEMNYTILFKDDSSSYTQSDIDNAKASLINGINSKLFPSEVLDMFRYTKEYGYDVIFTFQNEADEKLFSFNVFPYELE